MHLHVLHIVGFCFKNRELLAAPRLFYPLQRNLGAPCAVRRGATAQRYSSRPPLGGILRAVTYASAADLPLGSEPRVACGGPSTRALTSRRRALGWAVPRPTFPGEAGRGPEAAWSDV